MELDRRQGEHDSHSFSALSAPQVESLSLRPREDQFKVLLTGSFAVGKTTLLTKLRSMDGVEAVKENATEVLYNAPQIQFHPYFQQIMLWRQVESELLASRSENSLIVSDRGMLDPIFFSRALGIPFDESLALELANYQRVFLCIGHDIEVHHLYNAEEQLFRAHLESIIIKTLEELQIDYIKLAGTTEERLQTFAASLPNNKGTNRFNKSMKDVMNIVEAKPMDSHKDQVINPSESSADSIFKLSQLSGCWDNGARWNFYSAKDLPIFEPVTAVFCVALTPEGIVLTTTPRELKELLGGHSEHNETIHDTLRREAFEEGGIILENWVQLGCRQISMDKTVMNKSTGQPYPQRAYIPYFLAFSQQPLQSPSGTEVVSREVLPIQDALKLDMRVFPEKREFELIMRTCLEQAGIVIDENFTGITTQDIHNAILKITNTEREQCADHP